MTKSQAYKYSELFQLLSDPESLQLMVLLEESSDALSLEALASKAKSSTSEAQRHLAVFENQGIVNRTNKDGLEFYQYTTSKNGRFIQNVINRALEMYI